MRRARRRGRWSFGGGGQGRGAGRSPVRPGAVGRGVSNIGGRAEGLWCTGAVVRAPPGARRAPHPRPPPRGNGMGVTPRSLHEGSLHARAGRRCLPESACAGWRGAALPGRLAAVGGRAVCSGGVRQLWGPCSRGRAAAAAGAGVGAALPVCPEE
ncbi:MAG: hypothetical protein J3K34DRAFT_407077 [Monoraphidium minutum]|nr:MAG: hypothetical protein J3K34DRAFT_407077 [Monoraphidium minutum]